MSELNEEAVKAMIDEAVKGLNSKLVEREKKIADLEVALKKANDETDRIAQNRDSILREKRDLEGRKQPKTDEPQSVRLSREDARDPVKYRRARERAKKEGVELEIETDVEWDNHALPDRYENDSTLFVSHLYVRDGGTELYKALKAEAADAGKSLHIVTGANQLPKEAFDAPA